MLPADRASPVWSKRFSFPLTPVCGHRLDLAVIHYEIGVSFGYSCLNLLEMPLLGLKVCLHRFPKQISSVSVQRIREGIESSHLFGIEAETYCLFFHNSKYYS